MNKTFEAKNKVFDNFCHQKIQIQALYLFFSNLNVYERHQQYIFVSFHYAQMIIIRHFKIAIYELVIYFLKFVISASSYIFLSLELNESKETNHVSL